MLRSLCITSIFIACFSSVLTSETSEIKARRDARQIVTRYNLGENLEFLGALNIPIGPDGTEYGEIESGVEGIYFSTNASLFAQFAWYF